MYLLSFLDYASLLCACLERSPWKRSSRNQIPGLRSVLLRYAAFRVKISIILPLIMLRSRWLSARELSVLVYVILVLVLITDCLRVRPALLGIGFRLQGSANDASVPDVGVGVVRDLTSASSPLGHASQKIGLSTLNRSSDVPVFAGAASSGCA